MPLATGTTVLLGSLLFGVACALLVIGLRRGIASFLARRSEEFAPLLLNLRARATPRQEILRGTVAALAAFLVLHLMMGPVLGVAACAAVLALHPTYLRLRLSRRLEKFNGQIPDGLVALANVLKAGVTLPQAIRTVGTESPAPFGEEMAYVAAQYDLGAPIGQALEEASGRLKSPHFEVANAALETARERGGDLPKVLEQIAASIREIQRLEEHIKTISTKGKSAARLLAAMPLVVGGLMFGMDPDGMDLVMSHPLGILLLTIVAGIVGAGLYWIKRVTTIDV
jgi:tight adherence protein B